MMPDFQARCELLNRENEELRARIEQLEEMLGLDFDAPAWMSLTGREAKLFGVLLKRDSLTKAAAMIALYGHLPDGDVPEQKIIDVFICKLREKIRVFDLPIETNTGQGYFMTPATKKRAIELINRHKAHRDNGNGGATKGWSRPGC